jgi:hypothetical protein
MKKLWAARVAGLLALLGLSYWKNRFSYRKHRSNKWVVGKSIVDWVVVVLSAMYCPALLVGWTVGWITRPITSRGIQITLAILSGIALSSIGGVALEVLCVLAICSVDLLTGAKGVYGWWKLGPPDNFMPYLKAKNQ